MTVVCKKCHDKDANAIGCIQAFHEHIRSIKSVCDICGCNNQPTASCEKYKMSVVYPHKSCDKCIHAQSCYLFHESNGNVYKASTCISFIDKEAFDEITKLYQHKNKTRRIQTFDW